MSVCVDVSLLLSCTKSKQQSIIRNIEEKKAKLHIFFLPKSPSIAFYIYPHQYIVFTITITIIVGCTRHQLAFSLGASRETPSIVTYIHTYVCM